MKSRRRELNLLRGGLIAGALVSSIALVGLSSCAVTGVGVDGTVGVDYVGGYYEPWGYDYGGWGPGYAVGPWHDGHRFGGPGFHGGGRPPPHFRPGPVGRPMPSLPGRPRGR
jgi:hypothetical protein